MSDRRLIDTNLIIRHLTQDHAGHAAIANQLFAACDKRELTLVLLPAVLAECVFILESFYKHSRQAIARSMSVLIASPGMEIDNLEIHLNALSRYAVGKLHFVDCILAATATARQLSIASLHNGLRKSADVRIDLEV